MFDTNCISRTESHKIMYKNLIYLPECADIYQRDILSWMIVLDAGMGMRKRSKLCVHDGVMNSVRGTFFVPSCRGEGI